MKNIDLSSQSLKKRINKLPKSPGVYEFRDKQGKILYIGKATSLKDRVGSYFRGFQKGVRPRSYEESGRTPAMVSQIADIKIQETDSVLEALILESNLIKKHQPKYNVMAKDDKSFAYAVITKEKFPRILIVRETDLDKFKGMESNRNPAKSKPKPGFSLLANKSPEFPKARLLNFSKPSFYTKLFGPYTSKKQLEIALKLIRKIFPYHGARQISRNCCFDHQIGLCPGPHAGAISRKDYMKNIRGVKMILEGKKKSLVGKLEKEMKVFAKSNEFEKAAEVRNRIFALKHIRDVALISEDMSFFGHPMSKKDIGCLLRIEAYDVSNISGDFAVGSMIVFQNNHLDKSQYRKFKIKTVSGIDDVGMMREMLQRRFQNDWPLPDLIFVDGGKGHLNMAENVVAESGHDVPVVGVAKGPTRKKVDVYHGKEALIFQNIISDEKLVERIRDEAHRFAIGYHKKLRRKSWKEK